MADEGHARAAVHQQLPVMTPAPHHAAPLSRRAFVANAAALGAGVMIVPRHVLGGPASPRRATSSRSA
jgi:hypothetical protein